MEARNNRLPCLHAFNGLKRLNRHLVRSWLTAADRQLRDGQILLRREAFRPVSTLENFVRLGRLLRMDQCQSVP